MLFLGDQSVSPASNGRGVRRRPGPEYRRHSAGRRLSAAASTRALLDHQQDGPAFTDEGQRIVNDSWHGLESCL